MRFLAAALCLALIHCTAEKPKPAAPAAPDFFTPDPATAGRISGKVTFEGKAPAAKRISMAAEADCQKLHTSPVYDQIVSRSKDGGLANAFVYIKTGLEEKKFAPATEAVLLEQRGCQFIPQIVSLRAGQTLAVKNSDPVSHNVHPMPQNNRDWNQHQSPGAPDIERRFGFPEVMIPVKCNVHKWMKSYIAVLAHPYARITGPSGEFMIENVPPGAYTLAVWHEAAKEIVQTITVNPRETVTVAVSLH